MVALAPAARPLLGIDPGSKTLGLALSDRLWQIANPLKTLRRQKFAVNLASLQEIISDHEIIGIIIGLPLNMDGSEGPRAQSSRAMAQNLARDLELPVCLWDERLSTVSAERALLEGDMSRARRAQAIDKVAASIILQSALDRIARL